MFMVAMRVAIWRWRLSVILPFSGHFSHIWGGWRLSLLVTDRQVLCGQDLKFKVQGSKFKFQHPVFLFATLRLCVFALE
jgi:hypothetical protein